MATYTGVNTIEDSLNSLLQQDKPNANYEIVVVIDGPNEELRNKVDKVKKKFQDNNVQLTVKQFKKNKGRFEARMSAARLAKFDQILIVDDRVQLPNNFLTKISTYNEEVVMPDVHEKPAKNLISLTLNRLRRKIYGQGWGTEFDPYYIGKANFDKSPKGTTALWVNRAKFIKACDKIAENSSNLKHVNDDTKVLRYLVGEGSRIYKTSELRLTYTPRASAKEELVHIYHRAPRFLDYYFRPGTRYFVPLLGFYIFFIPVILIMIIFPKILIAVLSIYLLACIWLSQSLRDLPKIFLGLFLILISFGGGLLSNPIEKALRRLGK
jgi:glycosyltransferase involved in cell wall biosynthesis